MSEPTDDETACPATMCPYLGLTDGSPWTGSQQDECETSCAWWRDGHCLAGTEHDMPVMGVEGPVPPRNQWPSCPYEDSCQWQAQREGSCAPRMMLMFGQTIEETTLR